LPSESKLLPERGAVAASPIAAIAAAVGLRLPAARAPLVVGLCGAQGSGKSTLTSALAERFAAAGVRTAVLSLDDLYLTRAEREDLAASVHPLLRTRGVPGTHDVALGLATIAALERGEAAALPRFDKATDDRAPAESWPLAPAGTELLILEGWCVGARPEAEAALTERVNALERDEDPAGTWRRYANVALAGEYQALFARIDLLAMLAAPGFECVLGWRREQEDGLRRAAAPCAPGIMSDAALERFVQHYERLTRHILREMPARAEVVIELAPDRSARRITSR
jgi:D-glycerate 3-kinase